MVGVKGANAGIKHWNWRGGRYVKNGYIYIHTPNHPQCDSNGYAPEHRIVYERYHGCCLLKWIQIHHIDGNRQNNHINNLQPMKREEHTKLERTGRRKDTSDRFCQVCGSITTRVRHGWNEWNKTLGYWRCYRCVDREMKRKKRLHQRLSQAF